MDLRVTCNTARAVRRVASRQRLAPTMRRAQCSQRDSMKRTIAAERDLPTFPVTRRGRRGPPRAARAGDEPSRRSRHQPKPRLVGTGAIETPIGWVRIRRRVSGRRDKESAPARLRGRPRARLFRLPGSLSASQRVRVRSLPNGAVSGAFRVGRLNGDSVNGGGPSARPWARRRPPGSHAWRRAVRRA